MLTLLCDSVPWLCNHCQLPIGTAAAPHRPGQPVRSYPLGHDGQTYHFCSTPCRQFWWDDRDTMLQKTIVDRLLAGGIQPPTVEGILGS